MFRRQIPIVLMVLLFCQVSSAAPRVVVSIKPIHSLIAAVMEDIATPELLLRNSASPHDHALKPSQSRQLHEAGLIFWVGPTLEGFLLKPIQSLSADTRVIELIQEENLNLLTHRQGKEWRYADLHSHSADRELIDYDPHIWLDPYNAKVIVDIAVRELSRLDPNNSERYSSNGNKTQSRLDNLITSMKAKLESVKNVPFIVYHDGYQMLESRFNLSALGAITRHPGHTPSAKHVAWIKKTISNSETKCVFTEPQFQPKLIGVIVENTEISTATLDAIGVSLPEGPDAYFSIMGRLSDSLKTCLSH